MADASQLDTTKEYFFIGDKAQIGGGFGGMKPIAQNGMVVITKDGVLALYGSDGGLIDQAPVSDVSTKNIPLTGGQTVFVFLGEKRYSVTLNSIAGNIASGNLPMKTGLIGLIGAKKATNALVEAIENFLKK